jgi:agmatine deiminase
MARHLASSELVRIIVQDAMQARRVRETLRRAHADLERIECVILPYDRSWTRDTLPFFVRVGALRAIEVRHFRFNGWAKYRDYTRDTLLPPRIARRLRMHCVPVQRHGRHVVLEGGAIDTNGAGTLLTTEECLLDAVTQPRNPGLSRGDLERCWREHLGIRRTIWLNRGIAGDDTHGHVDDICRFVNRTTVVLAHEDNPRDINYRALHDNAERLQSARTADGQRIRVVRLPMPAPLFYNRHRLPASYANFYIANRVVLVPTFNDPRDRVALGILSELFPRRSVIGIHAVDLVWGFGSVHCLTHEQPA